MHASGAPSSACELRWTLRTEADVEAVVVHLRLAVDGPAPAMKVLLMGGQISFMGVTDTP